MGASSIGPSVKSLSQRLTIRPSSPAYSLLRQDEREQIDGIQADLKGVENTWKWIEALLADAEEKQIHEKLVRLWLHELRDLANKIEDLRDVCEYELVARKVEASKAASSSDGEVCRSTTIPLSPLVDASFREQVARDLKTINREFDAIAKRKEGLGLIEKADGQKHFVKDDFSWREPTGHVPTDPLFLGREREMEKLRRMLLADHVENVEVIAVTGMGGAGKTTLAQHAYKDDQIKSKFDKVGWVHVSNSFDGIHLIKGIIETFSGNVSNSHFQLSPLQDEVIKLVKGKKVLLVMDDVWSTESCKSVVALLSPEVKKGSKILITTRLPEVAAGASPINLESLSEDHGWSLLKKHAFPNRGHDVDNLKELEEIGKGILQKCKGLPLSIKLLGCLLCSKGNDEDKWREVLKSNLLDFQEVRKARLILGSSYLSYLHLSPKLKSCFKHCAIYPNYTVSPSHLKHSWMAYDLVKNWKEATECLTELASRSLLEWVPFKDICCMHDHIYDLAQFVLEEKCRYLDYDGTSAECPIELDFSDCRHASLNLLRGFPRAVINITHSNLNTLKISSKYVRRTSSGFEDYYGALEVHLSQVQSLRELNMDESSNMQLTSYDGYRNYLKCLRILSIGTSWSYIPGWLTQLYNLRYLKLSSSSVKYLPDEVCDLVNLRWLDLKLSAIKYLPESISRLVNLQELNLHKCQHLEALPESIISLTKLTILNLFGTRVSYMPKGFGALTELQDLTYFIIDSTQAGLAELKNMKHLEGNILIDNLCEVVSEEDAAQAGLASKKGLRELHLCWHKKALFKDADVFPYRSFDMRRLDEKFLLEEGNEEKIAQHEKRVFEQLRPHHNIEDILIYKYRGFELPSWMGHAYFTKLTSIALDGIHYCTSVSPIDQLPSLWSLTLSSMDSLEDLFPKSCIEPVDIKIMDPTTEKRLLSFPKLMMLNIKGCNSLKLLPLYKFSSLEYVSVSYCMNLEQMEPPYDITCPLKYINIYKCPKLHFSRDPHLPQPSWKLDLCEFPKILFWRDPHLPHLSWEHRLLFSTVIQVEKLIKELLNVSNTTTAVTENGLASNGTSLQQIEIGSNLRETQSILLERIASEMNRLKFYITNSKNLPFIENIEKRIQSASSLLDGSLRQCFVDGLEHRDANVIYNCLRAYAAIDNTTGAEEIFRTTIVSPLIRKIVPHEASQVSANMPNELDEDYRQIMECIEKDCRFLLDISSSANSGLHVFDFLANSILKEVLHAIQKFKPGALSPGRPTEFLKNYKSSLGFLAYLEGFCSSLPAVTKFRQGSVYAEFMKLWNIGVYFSLRFQEIAGALDSVLMSSAITIVQSLDIKEEKFSGLTLKQSTALLESLRSCWKEDVLVFSSSDKFLRLCLQLISRYMTWLSSGLAARKASGTNPNLGSDWATAASPEDFIYVLHDVRCLVAELSDGYTTIVLQLFSSCSHEVLKAVKESFVHAMKSLEDVIPAIVDAMTEAIVEKSIEDLRQLKGITAIYRMTNKPPPVRHSPYVSGVLRPLKTFLEGERASYLSNKDKTLFLTGACERITARYYELASEVVSVARKTESSLQRIRQGAQRRTGATSDLSDSNISDADKICMQLFLDIQEYGRNLASLGFAAAETPIYRSLWQCVAPPEKESDISF